MSAEFNVIGCQTPSFFIRFKPDLGDLSVKKLISSAIVRKLGGKSNGVDFVSSVAGLFPATVESKAAAGLMVNGIIRAEGHHGGSSARICGGKFRMGAQGSSVGGGGGGYRLPQLVMNNIRIEHVASKAADEETAGLEVIQAENGVLNND